MENISPISFISTKWKKADVIFFISLYFCFYFQELENISTIHFTSTKWKKLKSFTVLPNRKKISNRETGKYVYLQSGKNWSNFLHFSTYSTSFPQNGKHFIVAIYFHKVQKKWSNFPYILIYIYFFSFSRNGLHFTNAVYFHKVENISPALYFLEVDKCLMNCIIVK